MATKTKEAAFDNDAKYDPSGKGVDYGGGEPYTIEAMEEANEKGYYGYAPGDELDGDLTVQGVEGRDVVAEQKGPSGFKAGDASATEASGG